MTISHRNRFIWFRVAKVGTRSILRHLVNYASPIELQEASHLYYCPKLYSDYFKFAFVRNPWERLLSCWRDKVVQTNHFQFERSVHSRMKTFKEFVQLVSTLDLETCDRHLRLQSSLIDLNHLDYLGRMESWEEDTEYIFKRLHLASCAAPHLNASLGPKPSVYTHDLIEQVGRLYHRDIQLFGYRYEETL